MRKRIVSLLLTAVMMASLLTTMTATTVSAEDFVLDASKLLTGDSGVATFTTGASIGGKTGVLEVDTTSKTGIRYTNISLTPTYSAANRYLLVDIYYNKASSTTTPYGISATFRAIWKAGQNTDSWDLFNYNNGELRTKSSGLQAKPNRWVTIVIDCQAQMNKLSTESWTLKQLQIDLPQASGSDRVYIGDVRFTADFTNMGDYEFAKTSTIMSSGDLMSSPATVDFGGKTDVQRFSATATAHTIRYNDIFMYYPYSSINRYLLVECYLDDDNLSNFNLGATFRYVYNNSYIGSRTGAAVTSSTSLPTKQWVTFAIDCQTILSSFVTNAEMLTQMQIAIPATTANFYINSVRFAAEEPPVQMVFTNANGQYTYLSEDGIVTIGGNAIVAFTNTTDAFTALGVTGGTVYLEGNLTAFTDVANGTRGEILFRGLGDTAEDIAANVLYQINSIEIKGGDITFDYLTVEPYPNAESGTDYTSFFTCQTNAAPIKHITIGEHMVSTGMALGIRKGNETLYPNRDVFTINGGTYYAITPLSNYGLTTLNRLGSVDWTINSGTVHSLYAGSNNSWEWEQSQIRGDVKYTINGGTFDGRMVMGSGYGSTEIQGNVIWTVNGGDMSGRTIVGGDEHVTKGNRAQKYLQNVAAIVNLKGGKSGLSTLTLGTAGAKGLDINGKEIYILNNYEDNLGTQIADGSLAEYKMHVYNGKATPVFANNQTTTVNGSTENFGGALTGFTLTADEVGAVPYINGVKATPNGSGVYTIAEDTSGIIEIVFAQEGTSGVISFKKDGSTIKAEMYNFSGNIIPITMYIAKYQNGAVTDELKRVWIQNYNVTSPTSIQKGSISYEEEAGYTYRAFIWDSEYNALTKALDL